MSISYNLEMLLSVHILITLQAHKYMDVHKLPPKYFGLKTNFILHYCTNYIWVYYTLHSEVNRIALQ